MSKNLENFYQKKWFWSVVMITAIELYALSQGIDGIALAAVIGGLAGLGGYGLGKKETV